MTNPMIFPPQSKRKSRFNEMWDRSAPCVAWSVYVLRDTDTVVLYVGLSSNPRQRVFDHWRKQSWGEAIDSVDIVKTGTGHEPGLRAERHWIGTLKPLYNKTHIDYTPSKEAPRQQPSLPPEPKPVEDTTPFAPLLVEVQSKREDEAEARAQYEKTLRRFKAQLAQVRLR